MTDVCAIENNVVSLQHILLVMLEVALIIFLVTITIWTFLVKPYLDKKGKKGVAPSPSASDMMKETDGKDAKANGMPHVDLDTTNKLELEPMDSKKNEEKVGTRDLLLETLMKIGCRYEIDEKDERINFRWQGGYFVADASNDCPFVVVWFFQWDEYELYDIDALARVKKVINDANIHYNLNVVYSINEAGSCFYLHSKKHFLFIEQIPDLENYLQALLSQFFTVRHYVEVEIDKLKAKEESV